MSNSGDSASSNNNRFSLLVPPHIALDFRNTSDSTPPQGKLIIEETGGLASSGEVSYTLSGPYTLGGSTSPLNAFEKRELTITFSGSCTEVRQDSGSLTIGTGDNISTVTISSLIGDPSLPSISWVSDDYGTVATADMPHAPFPNAGSAWNDSSVFIMIPNGFIDDGHVAVVCHFHGFNTTLPNTIAAHSYDIQFAMSGRNAILIIPQGPVNAASGSFGKLDSADGMLNLCNDVLAVLYRDKFLSKPFLETTVLTSHAGGYPAIANIITQGGVPVSTVHLFDSLYGSVNVFAEFGNDGGLIRSNYTASGGTDSNNSTLRNSLNGTVISSFDDDSLLLRNHIIGSTAMTQSNADRGENTYGRWLRFSGLKPTSIDPPVLRYTRFDGNKTTVSWLPDSSDSSLNYIVEGSNNNQTWETLAVTGSNSVTVDTRPYIRVRQNKNSSLPSDTYGASGNHVLVVDGFDRCIGGSYNKFTHDFAASVANRISGGLFSIASNDSIAANEINMSSYSYVIWLTGDESSIDIPFSSQEQSAISAYLNQGGKIIISGSEIGYATSGTFFNTVLHAAYIGDDSGSTTAGDFNFGVAYPEDYPDVISGSDTIWNYSTSGAAAVGYENRIVVVGFPIETIQPDMMTGALTELIAYLDE